MSIDDIFEIYDSAERKWLVDNCEVVRTLMSQPASTNKQPDEWTLLNVLADIRQKTGVGDKPMLSELADVLTGLIKRESDVEKEAVLNNLGDLKEPWEKLCPYVSGTPELISLLYDLDLMPEQIHVRRNFIRLMQIAEWYKHYFPDWKSVDCHESFERGWEDTNGGCDKPSAEFWFQEGWSGGWSDGYNRGLEVEPLERAISKDQIIVAEDEVFRLIARGDHNRTPLFNTAKDTVRAVLKTLGYNEPEDAATP